jgi:hypothetical protein
VVTETAAVLKLYKANLGQPCCKGMKLLASQTTEADGRFDFGNIPSGEYWLAVMWEGKEMATAITVDVQKNWEGSCWEQGAVIGEKNFTWTTKVGNSYE